ncbi:MAG TPA: hypothetical protein VK540_18775 [Polyangiaceae bacterium]|nr:hypothetical protein [Polyangiaceae bacterium]
MVTSRLARAACQASAFLAAVFVLCAAPPAWACPSCTTRSGGGFMIPLLLGAMILTPYVVSTVVLRIVRKAEAERALEDQAASADTSSRSHVDPAADTAPARA